MNSFGKFAIAVLLGSTALGSVARADRDDDGRRAVRHVLLISVDGMHEVDLQRYVKGHPTSTFAKLLRHMKLKSGIEKKKHQALPDAG